MQACMHAVICACMSVHVCLLWFVSSFSVEGGEEDSTSSHRPMGGEEGPGDSLVPSVK